MDNSFAESNTSLFYALPPHPAKVTGKRLAVDEFLLLLLLFFLLLFFALWCGETVSLESKDPPVCRVLPPKRDDSMIGC